MATIQGPAADDDDATTRACGPHGIFCKGLWPLAGARRPLKERAKVARASSCNINVEKPLVFVRFSKRARVEMLKIREGFFEDLPCDSFDVMKLGAEIVKNPSVLKDFDVCARIKKNAWFPHGLI